MSLPLLGVIGKAIDAVVPDADKRLEYKMNAARLDMEGEFKPLDLAMQAIAMDAQSKDPWTSRARPAFLYVMYVMILSAIPIGVLFVFFPAQVHSGIQGFRLWLEAIPAELYGLFGAGYLGYVNKRSADKAAILGQENKQGLFSKLLG